MSAVVEPAITKLYGQLPPPSLADLRHVRRRYRQVFGRYPRLLRPSRFSEKMQWRKLFDLNPVYAILSDKIASRDFIAARIGSEFLPDLLWCGESPRDIPFAALEPPYVLKCNNGWNSNVFVTDRARLDEGRAGEELSRGLSRSHGRIMREPGYVPVVPRLLAERLLREPDGSPPLEHKLMVFDGEVQSIHTIVFNRERTVRRAICHDRHWNRLGWRAGLDLVHELPRPARLEQLVFLAERLGAGFDHLRVDIYDWAGGIMIGELTVYHLSGLTRYDPDEADVIMGSWWPLRRPALRALAAMAMR